MIEFGPRQMPDERLRVLEAWRYVNDDEIAKVLALRLIPPDVMRRYLQLMVIASSMYWANGDVASLVSDASQTMPDDVELLQELVPCVDGFVAFERPVLVGHDAQGPLLAKAILWHPVIRDDAAPGLRTASLDDQPAYHEVWVHAFAQTAAGAWYPLVSGQYDFGLALHSDTLMRYLFAFWAMVRSPGITNQTEQPQERHARKRSARAGASTDAVRVIRLRRHESSGHVDGVSHYHHRWIVSGHWRSQPYGPGRSQRKPVWIMPHVKGPEGAPMLTGEKVRVL